MEQLQLYTELDCFLDTRLGTLMTLWPTQTAEMIKDNDQYTKYVNRDSNRFTEWDWIDKDAFDERYKQRDVPVLKASVITDFCQYLSNMSRSLFEEHGPDALLRPPLITVNTWPYVLSQDDMDALPEMIRLKTCDLFEIKTIYMPLDKLELMSYKKYQYLFIYNYNQWLSKYTNALMSMAIHPTRLVIPKLIMNVDDNFPEKDGLDLAMMGLSVVYSSMVTIRGEDNRIFSIADLSKNNE